MFRLIRNYRIARLWAAAGVITLGSLTGCTHCTMCGGMEQDSEGGGCATGNCGSRGSGKSCGGVDGLLGYLKDPSADVPKGAQPQPLGSHVREFERRQTDKAEADDFVIYNSEWIEGGDRLGPFGMTHLSMITRRLPFVRFPVVIAVDPNPRLNEARRQIIVGVLTEIGIPDAANKVVLGFGEAEGLNGAEAPLAAQALLYAGLGGFGGGYGGGGGFGNFGGGSFGGTGSYGFGLGH